MDRRSSDGSRERRHDQQHPSHQVGAPPPGERQAEAIHAAPEPEAPAASEPTEPGEPLELRALEPEHLEPLERLERLESLEREPAEPRELLEPLEPPPVAARYARIGAEGLARLRARYAEVMARISERPLEEGAREELREKAERLNPDGWVTGEDVTAALEQYETVFEELRAVVGRAPRRRRRRRV